MNSMQTANMQVATNRSVSPRSVRDGPYNKEYNEYNAKQPSRSVVVDNNNKTNNNKTDSGGVDVSPCFVEQVGLENFIRTIMKELDLTMGENVVFNMNSCGIMQRWDQVFKVEKTYTACLGISKRTYRCLGYTHAPEPRRLAYFILEEDNERSYACLPEFSFHVMIFCYYDEDQIVTKVDVQYDQMSFFLHCVGLAALHRWVMMRIVTPAAVLWMRAFQATGLVSPITFLLQMLAVPLAVLGLVLYKLN